MRTRFPRSRRAIFPTASTRSAICSRVKPSGKTTRNGFGATAAAVVVGSRYAPGGKDDRVWLRVLASRLINGLATFVLGYGIRDYDSGFVVLRRGV